MSNVLDIFQERGFIEKTTDDEGIRELLEKPTACYIGFDPTAPSLHAGSLEPIMSLVHMQRCGHRPIVLVGGGTGLVGDPSGKTELRRVMSQEETEANAEALKKQLSHYLDFGEGKALMVNNVDWLGDLRYIEFLRDIGRHFSVNRMLTAESYRMRLETGLSFVEFNYMLLQAYDFYVLARDWDCEIQMGGQDQWGNIVAGADLTRRMMGKQVYGMTFPLITASGGEKFGKSAGNAVWLDGKKTSPYDFYQYWRNADDRDVETYLGLFTLLPMEEVKRLPKENVNRAKEILAFEATRLTHGKEEAVKAYTTSVNQFRMSDPETKILTSSEIKKVDEHVAGQYVAGHIINPPGETPLAVDTSIPTVRLRLSDLRDGFWVVKLFVEAGLCKSNGEARRLIQQGGAYLNDAQVDDDGREITEKDLVDRAVVLRAGKKRYKRVVFE